MTKSKDGMLVGPLLAALRLDTEAKDWLEEYVYNELCDNSNLGEKGVHRAVDRCTREIVVYWMGGFREGPTFLDPALYKVIKLALKGLTTSRVHKVLLPQALAWVEKQLPMIRRAAMKEESRGPE